MVSHLYGTSHLVLEIAISEVSTYIQAIVLWVHKAQEKGWGQESPLEKGVGSGVRSTRLASLLCQVLVL